MNAVPDPPHKSITIDPDLDHPVMKYSYASTCLGHGWYPAVTLFPELRILTLRLSLERLFIERKIRRIAFVLHLW